MAAITFRFPGSDSPDYAAAQVLADVLSSQRGKLYGLVPAGKALAASFSYEGLPKAGLGYAVAEFPAGADAAALVDQMRAILAAEATNGRARPTWSRRPNAAKSPARNSRRIPSPVSAMAWSQAVAVEGPRIAGR